MSFLKIKGAQNMLCFSRLPELSLCSEYFKHHMNACLFLARIMRYKVKLSDH